MILILFRKSTEYDIDIIMDIIYEAQTYFKQNNIDQWQNGYPDIDTIYEDISKGNGYVICKDGQIAATATVSFDEEPTYRNIYAGNWISDSKYAVIHRMAVENKFKGNRISTEIIYNVENICNAFSIPSIRIDTHRQNISMQKMLKNNEFVYCGIIYLSDGAERLAFEKILKGDSK